MTASGGKPELTFNGPLAISPAFPIPGQMVSVTWNACNYGTAATGTFTDVAELDGSQGSSRTVGPVAPGHCYTQSAQATASAGIHIWYVTLDAANQVAEQSEGNNVATASFTAR